MAKLKGTILASKIVPTDSLDDYATHEDKYGRGGHRSVDTLEERDNITIPRRKEGMTVYVKENKTKYILEGGIDNANWKVDSSGGGSGGPVDLSEYYKKTETYSKVEVDTKIADIPTTDLSGYYNKTETETLLSNKVDKEVGKGLSTNDFTNTFKQALESNKVQNVTTDSVNKKLVVTYTNGTSVDLNLDDVVTDVKVEGAVLDATTNVLTILSSDGGADVTVDLSVFVTNQTLSNALVGKAYKIHSHTTSDIDGLDIALSNKVTKNEAIIGATKTKITYDSNGLVTGGADLIEADLPNISQSKITNLVSDLSNKQSRLISGTNIKTINGQSVLGSGDIVITGGNMTPEQALSIEVLNKQLLDGSQNGDYSNFDLSVLNDNEWSGSPVYSGKIIPITDAELLSRGLVNWAYLTRGVKFNGIYNHAFVYKHYDYVITGKYFQNRYYVWSENGTDWGNHTSCITATGVNSGNGVGQLQSVSYEQITTNIRLYTVNGKVTQANARSIAIGTDFGVNANNNCDLAICGLGTILKDTLTTFPIIPMRKSYLDTTREITINNASNWKDKKVLWLGTSIPALGGHPEIVAKRLGFKLKNEALGRSLMRISKSNGSDMGYAPFNTLTFSRTIAEFQTKYPSNPEYEANSYENKLLGNLGQDLYIFDFGFNDYSADISDFTTLPAITSTDRSTFIGAFNYCIFKLLEQEPKARIAIIAHYEDQLKPNIVKAQEALAKYWGFPICSLNKKTGWSQIINPASGKTILNDWLPDGVHPHTDASGKSSALLARILEEFINGI